jgi:hypothetical protein
MTSARAGQKVERVTVTLLPTADDRSFPHIPSTFSTANRTYGWKHFEKIDYMLVPRKVSHSEIKIDIFVDLLSKRKMSGSGVQKLVEDFVNAKIRTDWHGFKLGAIGRPTEAEPPNKTFRRSTIEEIMGVQLDT